MQVKNLSYSDITLFFLFVFVVVVVLAASSSLQEGRAMGKRTGIF